MSNAFISGVIANKTFLKDFNLTTIKQKYGSVSDVDVFVSQQKHILRSSMLEMGLAQKHLDLLFALDDFKYQSEEAMLQFIASYSGSKAGECYRDTVLRMYDKLNKDCVLDLELVFDEALMKAMHPFLNQFVDVDGILAHIFFSLIEIKNVAIVLKADHYRIEAESRLRRHAF